MTGPEHYREAEATLKHAETCGFPLAQQTIIYRCAQVHATLALAAATAMNFPVGDGMTQAERTAWREAAGTRAKAGVFNA
jgi:hypothetical protein